MITTIILGVSAIIGIALLMNLSFKDAYVFDKDGNEIEEE